MIVKEAKDDTTCIQIMNIHWICSCSSYSVNNERGDKGELVMGRVAGAAKIGQLDCSLNSLVSSWDNKIFIKVNKRHYLSHCLNTDQ